MSQIMRLEGGMDLRRAIERQVGVLRRRDVTSALRFASTPIRRAMRRNIPKRTGTTRKSVRTKALKRSSVAVAIRPDFRRGGQAAHLIEFGTARRATAAGANRGVMPANRFIEKSSKAGRAEAFVRLRRKLAEKIQKAARAKA